jgi:hypothetical protein
VNLIGTRLSIATKAVLRPSPSQTKEHGSDDEENENEGL